MRLHALLHHFERASCFAFEIENSVSSWLLRSNVNGDFSGRDIRSDLDIPDGARPEEQAFHITGNREVQLNAGSRAKL